MTKCTVARAGIVGLLAASTFTLNVGTASAADDPCRAQMIGVRQVDGQFSGLSAQVSALQAQIAGHNARWRIFRLPQQNAALNAYNAEARTLNARQAALRAQAARLQSARAQAARAVQACRQQVAEREQAELAERRAAHAEAQREIQRRFEEAVAERREWDERGLEKAMKCVQAAAEHVAKSEPPGPGDQSKPDTGALKVIIGCMDGVRETLTGG
jgi:DNA anti-recombination protein RmuC